MTKNRDSIKQACAIPIRLCKKGGKIEVCLITSIRKGRWGFPKGIIDPGQTAIETALTEAKEEAGLSGNILAPPLGDYRYHKWGTTLSVTVYLMEVTHMADIWEESHLRRRRWMRCDKAKILLRRPDHRELLAKAISRWNNRSSSD